MSAAEAFESADSQAPSPTALEYAIRAREKAAQLDRAATLAALAARRHPDDKNLAKLAPGVLQRARSQLHDLSVRCAEPCELAVGGKIVHGAPETERSVFLTPGAHEVRAGFSGDRSASQTIEAAAGGQSVVSFDAPEPEPEPAAEPEPVAPPAPAPDPAPVEPAPRVSSGWSPTVFWVGVGLTGAATAATIWSGIDTLNNPGEDRVKEVCASTDCDEYRQGLANQRRTNVLLGVTAGVGVATFLVGALLTDWGGGAREEASALGRGKVPRLPRARVEPWVSVGSGALVGAAGRF